MIRSPNLRTILARSLVAAMALEASACCDGAPPAESRVVELREGSKWNALVENCREDEAECETLCRLVMQEIEDGAVSEYRNFYRCELDDTAALPRLYMEYDDGSACGRRAMVDADRLVTEDQRKGASYFVRAALLEAEAVQAFHEMAGHLLGFGAPEALVKRCRRAAQEELGHALSVGKIARKLGGDPTLLPNLRSGAQIWRDARMGVAVHAPTLFDFAEHNAVEGCVRESLGAVVALWQSLHSSDPELRRTLAFIAEEEVAHAELSWDIDRWCRSQLSEQEAIALAASKRRAGADLWRRLSANDNESGGLAGLPNTSASRQLLDRIAGSTWAAAESKSCA
jgi:hypothetical protein